MGLNWTSKKYKFLVQNSIESPKAGLEQETLTERVNQDFNLFFDSNLEVKGGKLQISSKRKIYCENDRVNGRVWFMWYLEN